MQNSSERIRTIHQSEDNTPIKSIQPLEMSSLRSVFPFLASGSTANSVGTTSSVPEQSLSAVPPPASGLNTSKQLSQDCRTVPTIVVLRPEGDEAVDALYEVYETYLTQGVKLDQEHRAMTFEEALQREATRTLGTKISDPIVYALSDRTRESPAWGRDEAIKGARDVIQKVVDGVVDRRIRLAARELRNLHR